MNKDNPTIWMNVTSSVNWTRPPVGIVRVERALCTELGRLYGSQFKQCVWQGNQFVEWTPSEITHAPVVGPAPVKNLTETEKTELPLIYPVLSKRQALTVMVQGALSLMPGKLRPYTNRLLHAVRPYARRMLKFLRTAKPEVQAQPVPKNPEEKNTQSPFARGDVLISVGLDWDSAYYKNFYFLRKNDGVKVVTCCYDLIPVIYPQYCVSDVAGIFTSYFLEVADGSDLVLCISKQSEKDFNEMLTRTGGACPATHVFPLGDNVPVASNEEVSSAVQSVCQTPFILFVSTIERRKNHEVLYRAYHLLCEQGKQATLPKLVFVGMQGWGVGELLKDIELDPLTQGKIVRLNHVNDTELRTLYESALLCVFPSLYEGWGLPVGEALAMGKAVLCSDRGSLPEVGGDLVRYVDPWSPQSWADELLKMIDDDTWRNAWEQKVRDNYSARTWARAAQSVKNSVDLLM